MGFLSKAFDFVGDVVDDFTGKTQERAAKRAGEAQFQASEAARDQLLKLNRPFIDIGANAIPGLKSFVDDPTGANFLQGNPLFGAAVDNANRVTSNAAAASGRFNSGGLVNELFKNYLAIGDQFVNSGFNRAFEPVRLGQNAAAGTGADAANLITQGGNAQAAGLVGAANAGAAGTGNLLGLAGAVAGGPIGAGIGGFAKDAVGLFGSDFTG